MTAICESVAKKQHQTTSHDTLIQEYLFFFISILVNLSIISSDSLPPVNIDIEPDTHQITCTYAAIKNSQ